MGSFESVSVSSKKTPNSSMNNVSNRNNKESKGKSSMKKKGRSIIHEFILTFILLTS